jgi:hypothetical protein
MNSIEFNELERDFSSKEEMILDIAGQEKIEAICPGDIKMEQNFSFIQIVILIIAYLIVFMKYDMDEQTSEMFSNASESFAVYYTAGLGIWMAFKRRKMDDLLMLGEKSLFILDGVYEHKKTGRVSYQKLYKMDRNKLQKEFNWFNLGFSVKGFIKVKASQKLFYNPAKPYGPEAMRVWDIKKAVFKS